MLISRRTFGKQLGLASTALAVGGQSLWGAGTTRTGANCPGALVPDPMGFLDLPEGYSYRTIARAGVKMTDGFHFPMDGAGVGVV
ncbi:MAG: phosphatase, partial [Rhodothermales bacterium]|nr:phosphatase [Rhodothermales bacterium]